MAYNEKRVQGILLTGSAVTLYTVTAPVSKAIIKEMKFCNTDITTAYTFTIYTIPLAGSAADANTDFKAVTLQPGETKIFGRTDVLEVGNFIQGLASTTNKISFSCSLLEKT